MNAVARGEPRRGPRLAIIPAPAIADRRLKPRDLQVLCLLGTYTDDEGWCWPSQVTMSEQLGCARSTVQDALTRLVACGWVEQRAQVRRDGGTSSHLYRVRLDVSGEEMARPVIGAADEAAQETGVHDSGENSTPPAGISAPPAGIPAPPADPWTGTHKNDPLNDTHRTVPPLPPQGERESARAKGRADDGGGEAAEDREGFEAFFAAWLKVDARHVTDAEGPAFAAWRRLTADERAEAAEPEMLTRHRAEELRRGPRDKCSAATWLKERRWRRYREGATADPLPMLSVAAWSRVWWVLWWLMATRRDRRLSFLVSEARKGLAFWVKPEEHPPPDMVAGFVDVARASDEFRAWDDWCSARRIALPRPDTATHVFFPSRFPPVDEAA
jgi:predicted transcriptional regulator